jgi:hypothetical protein
VLLRLCYGPLLYATWYQQTATIWPVLYSHPFDEWLVRFEAWLWGTQPSLAFAQAAPWPWLSELFCGAYYLYYYFTPTLLTVLLTRGYASAGAAIFTATLCFCVATRCSGSSPTIIFHYWLPLHAGPQPYQVTSSTTCYSSHPCRRSSDGRLAFVSLAVATVLTIRLAASRHGCSPCS